ncbi:transmembrane protein 244 [Mustela nigripes]|uniref:transmembrane protein 244 n=1 Tax=Mustela nigripes TaxID=77151 RepID=UPI0028167EB6|nr:transmembrane protein 244 [Mustela nigripes]
MIGIRIYNEMETLLILEMNPFVAGSSETLRHQKRGLKDVISRKSVPFATFLTKDAPMALQTRVAPSKKQSTQHPLGTCQKHKFLGPISDLLNQKLQNWGPEICVLAGLKLVLQNLLVCVILFYTMYYAKTILICNIFRVYELDVLAPFDFKTNTSWHNTNYKVLLVSTQVTYFVCGLLFVLVVEEWVWDYAVSVTILHVVITSAVMLEFPLTSHWWASLGIDT